LRNYTIAIWHNICTKLTLSLDPPNPWNKAISITSLRRLSLILIAHLGRYTCMYLRGFGNLFWKEFFHLLAVTKTNELNNASAFTAVLLVSWFCDVSIFLHTMERVFRSTYIHTHICPIIRKLFHFTALLSEDVSCCSTPQPGWPDWANFRILGDYLLRVFFIYKGRPNFLAFSHLLTSLSINFKNEIYRVSF
jgi:hypothetical protein